MTNASGVGVIINFSMLRFSLLFLVFVAGAAGQNGRMDGGGERAHIAVPMTGAGTYEDPRRPAFVREAGIPYRYQVSDDGTMALVEVTPRTPGELDKFEKRLAAEPRAKVFKPGRDKKADMLVEFRKWKKDYDPEELAKPGVRVGVDGAK
ncbi:MAG: hypothetical protein JNM66_30025 [Bryobacterales bacterium]|nr:hypothetical protein [Bryobacterales bacterium]